MSDNIPFYKTKEYRRSYYQKNKEKLNLRSRELYKNKKDKKKAYRLKNKEKISNYLFNWRKKNSDYMSKYMKKRREIFPGKVKSEERLKDSNRRQRNIYIGLKTEFEEIYNNCPKEHVVDHIIPLQNKNVSGLHVPWNLQYLTNEENNFKRNSFDFTINNNSWKERFKGQYER